MATRRNSPKSGAARVKRRYTGKDASNKKAKQRFKKTNKKLE